MRQKCFAGHFQILEWGRNVSPGTSKFWNGAEMFRRAVPNFGTGQKCFAGHFQNLEWGKNVSPGCSKTWNGINKFWERAN